MKLTIQCMYSCYKCGVVKRKVNVPARADEDVIVWTTEVLAAALSRDHAAFSPGCIVSELEHVWIPLRPDSTKIGEALNPPVAT